MKRYLLIGALILISLESRAADYSGTSSFNFLTIPTGARATAMGQAFTTVPNDVQGLVYNPASLATLVVSQASFQHLSYVESIVQEGLAWGHPSHDSGLSWGLLANYLSVGGIERTVATLQSSGDGFTEQGTFSTYDMMLGVVLAERLGDSWCVGTTAKFLRESLADASSTGGAVDAGVLYQNNSRRLWNAGLAVQNVGFASKFADAAVQLPLTVRAGVSSQPFSQWLLSGDFVKRRDTKGEFDVGAELTPKRLFSLRVGYRYALQRPDLGGLADFSVGIGFRWDTLSFDYAFIPLGDLGMTHRVSLNLRFKPHRDPQT